MGELFDFIGSILVWLVELLLWLPLKLWSLFLDGLAAVIEAIPVPAWLENVDLFGNLDPGVLYFAAAFEIPAGLGIITSAYLIRFLIRRLPFVG